MLCHFYIGSTPILCQFYTKLPSQNVKNYLSTDDQVQEFRDSFSLSGLATAIFLGLDQQKMTWHSVWVDKKNDNRKKFTYIVTLTQFLRIDP